MTDQLDMTPDPDWSDWQRPTVKQSLTVQPMDDFDQLKAQKDALASRYKLQAVFNTPEEYEDFKAWWEERITKRLKEKEHELQQYKRERGLPEQLYSELSRDHDALRAAGTNAYNALVDAMETLIVSDHISMMRHPQLVDKLHQAVNGLKRTLHACKP
jgi:hypothetical protein